MKSKLAFVRQPDSIPRKTAFSLRCFAAILLRLPPKTEAHGTPVLGGEQNRIRFQTVHQEQSCWAVFLFGGDAYSVSAFQNHHRQAQPRTVRCCRGRLPERRTAVQRVRPENEILQQEERACPRRDHAAIPCAARICRPGNALERRRSCGEPVELPACPPHRAGIDMVLNKQQLSAPGGKAPEKESVLKQLEQLQQEKSKHKAITSINREESL